MIQIRRNVFETNSSSMHSVALSPNASGFISRLDEALAQDSRMKVVDNTLIIDDTSDLEFGWGPEVADTFYGKLCYMIASYVNIVYKSDYKTLRYVSGMPDILRILKHVFPEIQKIELPKDEDGNLYSGYIDHQSSGMLSTFLLDKAYTREQILRDNSVVIIVDNDNADMEDQIWGYSIIR